MFSKILIANRGEIACRVAATARRLGVRTVAVCSDVDAHAKHVALCDEVVNLGGAAPKDSYLKWQAIIDAARAANAHVLLVGVEMPPNYGPDYADAFRAMFTALAKQNETALLPFLLEPIATDLSWFQPDTIHPTAAAQPKVMEHVWPALESLLE